MQIWVSSSSLGINSSRAISTDEGVADVKFELLPTLDFDYESSRRKIVLLPIPHIPAHFEDRERAIYFSTLIDFEHIETVSAMGGLLRLICAIVFFLFLIKANRFLKLATLRMYSVSFIHMYINGTHSIIV